MNPAVARPSAMPAAPLPELLRAVRRRLWSSQCAAAVRLGAWGTAALMLLGAAAHFVIRPLAIDAVVVAAAVWWTVLLAREGLRRPSDHDCALWADRRLDGQSAFTTWLEVGRSPACAADSPAVRFLGQWAAARVPQALQQLALAREAPRISRPLAMMAVCSALAAIVFSLPDLGPSAGSAPIASAPAHAADRSAPIAAVPASNELVREVASALRSPATREEAARRSGTGSTAAAQGRIGEAENATATTSIATPAPPSAASGGAAAAMPTGGGTPAAGSSSGREAGDSRDLRSGALASQAAAPTLPVPRSPLPARQPAAAWQADPETMGSFDDDLAAPGVPTKTAGQPVMAASPPPATDSLHLTPTQTSYVQAWLKATARRP